MLFRISDNLSQALRLAPSPEAEPVDPFFSWTADLFAFPGASEKSVLMINQATRVITAFPLPEGGASAAGLMEGLRTILQRGLAPEDVPESVVSQYFEAAGPLRLAQEARANDIIEPEVFFMEAARAKPPLDRLGPGQTARHYCLSSDEFIRSLSRFGHKDKRVPALELESRLLLEGEDAVRRLVVPYRITFDDLHKVLQGAYQWFGYHLFAFEFYLDGSKPEDVAQNPDVEIVMSDGIEETYNYDEMLDGDRLDDGDPGIFAHLEQGEKIILRSEENMLEKLIPRFTSFIYLWDFGDNWNHEITVKKLHTNYKGWLPDLLSGSGDAPPEDCGGASRFKEFKEILVDPSHQEYAMTVLWASAWRPFNFEACRNFVQAVRTIGKRRWLRRP
jgi:hypothetical protein